MSESSSIAGRRIAVLGAGLAGLTAARTLVRAGANVTVLEAEAFVGGRSRTDELEGTRVDVGTQLVGSMYRHFLALVRELGLGEALRVAPGRDALWRGGKAHEVVYGSVTSMVASGGLPFTTKMRLGATYVPFLSRHAKDLQLLQPERIAEAGLDGESIDQWGRREIDEAFVRSLVYPQLAAYYASEPARTSAGLYHLLAHHGMDVDLYAVDGGFGRVCEALRAEVEGGGGTVRCEAAVEAVRVGDGVVVQAGGDEALFDAAVSALPAPTLRHCLSGAIPSLERWLGKVRCAPTLTAAFVLNRPVQAGYFGLSFPQGDADAVAAVCVEQNKPAHLVPGGAGLLVVIARPEVAPQLLAAESREVVDRLLPDVERAFPGVSDSIVRARVYRWPAGSPVFYPGYFSHLGAFGNGEVEANGPLAIAGDYLYSPSVEGAVVSGERAAQRIIRRLAGRD